MKKNSLLSIIFYRIFLICLLLFITIPVLAQLTIFNVTNTNSTGAGSLRQAISDVNGSANSGPFEIRFSIGVSGSSQTINILSTNLPDISRNNTTVKGLTQGASVCNPIITINFNGLARGFRTAAGINNITIEGLVIQNCSRAIHFQQGSGHIVKSCFIGTSSNGNATGPWSLSSTLLDGITLDGSENCIIGGSNSCDRNVITGYRYGIYMLGTGNANEVKNCYVGIGADGSTILSNNVDGIRVDNANTNVVIGGSGAFERNVISGNLQHGININNSAATGAVILNNYIGFDATGLLERSNGTTATSGSWCGININAGSARVEGNVIGGNGALYTMYKYGVHFASGSNHQLINNIIGLDKTGLAKADNFGSNNDGVRFTGSSTGHSVIGNTICNAGNGLPPTATAPQEGRGIAFMGSVSNTVIQSNKLGVDITGNTPKGNYEHGLFFNSTGSDVQIGGTDAERNYVGGNGYRNGSTAQLRHGIGGNKPSIKTGFNIINNYIGIGADGVTNVGNANFGLSFEQLNASVIRENICHYNKVGLFFATCGGTAGVSSSGNLVTNNDFSYNNDPSASSYCAGIVLQEGSNNNKIINNTINYNKQGIWIRAQDPAFPATGDNNYNIIRGNTISYNTGTAGGTTFTAPEASGNGIVISTNSDRNYIGGPLSSHDNFIHHNSGNGIVIFEGASTENKIRRNSIYCNGLKGVELFNAGNNNKPHPGAFLNPASTNPQLMATSGGNLSSDTVEVFYDPDCACQGKIFLGLATVNAAGNWVFNGPIPTVNSNQLTVRGTANTNPDYGNSSEFSCNQILPVQLIKFQASKESGNTAMLTWITAGEKNNSHFIVQKSSNGDDWFEIANVKGAGTSIMQSQYNFYDKSDNIGVVFYRLIQVDFDNSHYTSNIEVLDFDKMNGFSVYPNPFSDLIRIISVQSLEGLLIEAVICDLTGRVLFSEILNFQETEISSGDFPPGLYLLKIRTNDHMEFIYKLIKENN
ncbi:MAG: T9SS type A sorting domain-containing protein [Cytophagaceae bacterium]